MTVYRTEEGPEGRGPAACSPREPGSPGGAPAEEPSAYDESATGRKGKTGRWKRLPFGLRLFLLAGAAFVVGLASVNYLLMPLIVHRSKEVKVPALVGLPFEEASSALEEKSLSIRNLGAVYDALIPEGRVVKQEPAAGTSVRKDRLVSVVLSNGPDVAAVPELGGQSLRHARMLLARLGLEQGPVAHSFSPEVPTDYIIGTDPAAGTSLHRGSSVSLLVSLGPEADDYVMPDLLGLPLSQTANALEGLGFAVRVKERGWASFFRRSAPRIEKQRPLPGKRVRKRDEIVLSP